VKIINSILFPCTLPTFRQVLAGYSQSLEQPTRLASMRSISDRGFTDMNMSAGRGAGNGVSESDKWYSSLPEIGD
jgi:hypothetical protein